MDRHPKERSSPNEDYLKFLRYKNTPIPDDINPKRLKYDNYYRYNEDNLNYNYKNLQSNIISPSPFKNIGVFYKEKDVSPNLNLKSQLLKSKKKTQEKLPNQGSTCLNNNTHSQVGYINRNFPSYNTGYLNNQNSIPPTNYNIPNNNKNYQTKYPVEMSFKKKVSELNKEVEGFNKFYGNNHYNNQGRYGYNNYPSSDSEIWDRKNHFYNNNNCMPSNGLKVINADEFINGKRNEMQGNNYSTW